MMFYICKFPKSPVSLHEIQSNVSPDFWVVPWTIRRQINLILNASDNSTAFSFISYLLRFSDRIDRMQNSYGNFRIQSQPRDDFLARGKRFSSNQKSAVKMNQSVRNACTLLLAPFQSSFTEVCLSRFSTPS